MNLKKHVTNFIFMVICSFISISFISAQKLYKTTLSQAGLVFGSSISSFTTGQLIEHKKGSISIEDITALSSESIFDLDQSTIGNFSPEAAILSDYFRDGVWVAPLTLFLSDQARENSKEILTMYAEVILLNGGITGMAKGGLGRFRPYAYNPEVSLDLKLASTTRRSFFSGHTSHVASLSFFTATVFDDLYPESDFKYVVWAGAIAAPAITGYLRVKAGRHFPTDVVVGYGIGALVGYLIPEFHKITRDTHIEVIGAEGGLGMIYNF